MDLGRRLRQLREAHKLSQADIEHRTSLMCSYISRVENGHTVPSVETLTKWAHALDLELYHVFFEDRRGPEVVKIQLDGLLPIERELLNSFRAIGDADRKFLLTLARRLGERGGKNIL